MEISLIEIIALILLASISLAGIHAIRKEQRRKWILSENMPDELANAKLVMSEQYIHCKKPRKMRGTPDQVYRRKDGYLIPIDTKTRDQYVVYRKDIVQVSVYKLILEQMGKRVEDYGYFRIVTPDGIKYIKRNLLSEQEVIDEYDRTKRLLSGEDTPKPAPNRAMCKGCGQQGRCDFWEYKQG